MAWDGHGFYNRFWNGKLMDCECFCTQIDLTGGPAIRIDFADYSMTVISKDSFNNQDFRKKVWK